MRRAPGVGGVVVGLILIAGCEASPGERARQAEARGDWTAAAEAWAELEGAGATSGAAALGLGRARARLAHPQAEVTLERALVAADAAGDRVTSSDARQELARIAMAQGRFEAALAHVDRALTDSTDAGRTRALRLTRAAVLWRWGDYDGAEATWRAVRGEATLAGETGLATRASEGLAGAARFAGRFGEAAGLCAAVEAAAAVQSEPGERARSLANCGAIRGFVGETTRALALTGAAVAAADASGAARPRIHARNARASVFIESGAAGAALPVADEAVALAQAAGLADLLGDALLYRALAQERLAQTEAAAATLAALPPLEGPPSATMAEAHALAGRLALVRGEREAALAAFERAVDGIEAQRAAVTPRQLHDFFDHDRRAPYVGLVELLGRRGAPGDAERALATIGRLESRSFLEGLRARGGPTPLPPGEFDPRALRRALPADTAVIALVPLAETTMVFWVTPDAVELQWSPLPGAQAAEMGRALTARLAVHEPTADLEDRLARALLAPLASRLGGHEAGRPIAVVAHGPLRGLPLDVLPFEGRPLARRHPVFSAPSLPALVTWASTTRPPSADSRPLVVADTRGDLPGARAAALELGVRLPGARLLLGVEATETNVRAALRGADPVHFGVHGYAATPAHPAWLALAAGEGHDGRLDAAEVATLVLDAPLVVLSACETSVAPAHATGEAPGVLDRAFLHAGARAVISTRWPVNDQIARRFDEAFFDALPTHGALGAFHRAREHLAAGGPLAVAATGPERGLRPPGGAAPPPPDARQPGYWAAFVYHGSPR